MLRILVVVALLLSVSNFSFAKERDGSSDFRLKTSDESLAGRAEDHERNEERDRQRAEAVARHACEAGCGAMTGAAGTIVRSGTAGAVVGVVGVACAVGCNH